MQFIQSSIYILVSYAKMQNKVYTFWVLLFTHGTIKLSFKA